MYRLEYPPKIKRPFFLVLAFMCLKFTVIVLAGIGELMAIWALGLYALRFNLVIWAWANRSEYEPIAEMFLSLSCEE